MRHWQYVPETIEQQKFDELKRFEAKERDIERKFNECDTFEKFKVTYKNILEEIDNRGEYEYMKIVWKLAKKICTHRGWRLL